MAMMDSTESWRVKSAPATAPRLMTMISADRMKSVRTAPLILFALERDHVDGLVLQGLGARRMMAFGGSAVRKVFVRQLFDAFIAKECAAQHQQRRHGPRRERA